MQNSTNLHLLLRASCVACVDGENQTSSLDGGVSNLSGDLLSSCAIFAPACRSSFSLVLLLLPLAVCSSSLLPGALCDMFD
jgi:hypothetical protein